MTDHEADEGGVQAPQVGAEGGGGSTSAMAGAEGHGQGQGHTGHAPGVVLPTDSIAVGTEEGAFASVDWLPPGLGTN